MDAELYALASTGATALVGLMVSDAWSGARTGVARLFARNGAGREEVLEGELDSARARLALPAGSGDDRSVETEWQARFEALLGAHPQAADELRTLLAELAPRTPHQQARGGVVFYGSTVNGAHLGDGDQTNNFGS